MYELYKTHFKIHIAWALHYRVMLALWAIAGITEALVALAVWHAVAAASGGSVGSYDQASFAAYFIAVMLVSEWTHGWVFWTWEWRVSEGSFSSRLLQPEHPLHADLIDNFATKCITMAIKTPIAVVIAHAFGATFTDDPLHWLALVPALALAYVLRMMLEASLACMAFWLTRIAALAQVYYMLWSFTSGQFAPVDLLPEPLASLAHVLPFQWALGFPVELALGRLNPGEIATGLAMQAGWIVVSVALFRTLWRAASKRYTAVGS